MSIEISSFFRSLFSIFEMILCICLHYIINDDAARFGRNVPPIVH